MSKLNPKAKSISTNIHVVAAQRDQKLGYSTNGNLQFVKSELQMLYELVTTTMFGKSSDDKVAQIRKYVKIAVDQGAEDFVANLAIHARMEMNVRTIPIVLVVELAKAMSDKRQPILDEIKRLESTRLPGMGTNKTNHMCEQINYLRITADTFNYVNMRRLVCDVIQRADEITGMYAYALQVFGNKQNVPMAIKRGVGDAFNKFNEYSFGKYNRDGAVKFRDVLRIVHPTAKSITQGQIFDKIMKDTLQVPYTWETELSNWGQQPQEERISKAALWEQLIDSGKVGFMAILRNLRNIHEAGVSSNHIKKVCNQLSDPIQVSKSKQLPYDFMEAYKIVKPLDSKMATAVSKAIDLSVSNIPQMGEKVWLIIDYSGSMGQPSVEISAISSAVFLASALLKANADSDKLAVTLFGTSAKTLKGVDTNNSMIAIQQDLLRHREGSIAGSTNFAAALAEYSNLGWTPDTIIVLTDGEVNGFPYGRLVEVSRNKAIKMTVNLSQAFTTPMTREDGWYSLAGWSPSMFRWTSAIRNKETVIEALSKQYMGVPNKVTVGE